MTASAYWRVARPRKGKALPNELRWILEKRHVASGEDDPLTLTRAHDLPYLQGLVDAGIRNAGPLLEALTKWDAIEIWWQW